MSMPRINVLKPERTHHFSLGPKPHNEGTTKGTYDVLETIFVEQFHREPKDFEEILTLVYGDQKTINEASKMRGGRPLQVLMIVIGGSYPYQLSFICDRPSSG